MAQDVFFAPLIEDAAAFAEPDLRPGLRALGRALGLPGAGPGDWAVKVHLGPRNRPAAVDAAWATAVGEILAGTGQGAFAFDTLSITTEGLDEAIAHQELAYVKGFGNGDLPYVVADGPEQGPSLGTIPPADSELTDHALAGGLAAARNLCVLTPIRPHPHVGLRGAITTMGVGLADRASKIALHENIRPKVDTPLCAGCGVCMTVCLFDAIKLSAGRAFIDHKLCTGCGECMNVCFMAGINPAEEEGVPAFQAKVADAALAARDRLTDGEASRQVYFNFLVRLDRQGGGARSRQRNRLGNIGILASRDPVALDQATFEMITERMGGKLGDWSGFKQLPETLLARAEAIGLGETAYNLVTV
jgi:uncharacterized Fe-S center protein